MMSYGYSEVVQTGGNSSSNGGRSKVKDSIAGFDQSLGEDPEPIGSVSHEPGTTSESSIGGSKEMQKAQEGTKAARGNEGVSARLQHAHQEQRKKQFTTGRAL